LTLEKYKRADEIKIKELNLAIEKLTVDWLEISRKYRKMNKRIIDYLIDFVVFNFKAEVGRKQNELEKEITETQAS